MKYSAVFFNSQLSSLLEKFFFYGRPSVYYRVHKSPPIVPIPSHRKLLVH